MGKTIIIVGAGISGLMAARELARSGYSVTIVEAEDRVGGRIHTIANDGFSHPVAAGAEFVHGYQPFTLKLFKEADIAYHTVNGEIWEHEQGSIKEEESFVEYNSRLKAELEKLQEDITVEEFLEKHFSGHQYAELRASVIRYIEGYEAADIHQASMLAMKGDILRQDEDQFRPKGGYGALVDYMVEECIKLGCRIHLSNPVDEVHWQKNSVTVVTKKGSYKSHKLLLTVSIGVLQQMANSGNAIVFHPAITTKVNAAKKIGFGSVIKILLEFHEAFWTREEIRSKLGKNAGEFGFLFSKEVIPTWWTQLPHKNNLLTGWLGGPDAAKLATASGDEVLQLALDSLSKIFKMEDMELRRLLRASHIANWRANKWTNGAYAYRAVGSDIAIMELNTPLDNTIFLAGEGLYMGPAAGTVEAALTSAVNTVRLILKA